MRPNRSLKVDCSGPSTIVDDDNEFDFDFMPKLERQSSPEINSSPRKVKELNDKNKNYLKSINPKVFY